MQVLVIGPGSLGATYGVLLQKAGHDVYFKSRENTYFSPASTQELRIYFKKYERYETLTHPIMHANPFEFFISTPLDIVIVALKTTENHVLEYILPRYVTQPETIILVLQNGIGNEEHIARILPENPIVCAVTTIAATRNDQREVYVQRVGTFKIAPYNTNAEAACFTVIDAFDASPIPLNIEPYRSHKQIRWEKLMWNIPFNSLSTLCRISSNHLIAHPTQETFVRHLMQEIIQIAAFEGAIIPESMINDLLEATRVLGDYHPSMYEDFLHERPLEHVYIIQNAKAIAAKHTLHTPLLDFIEAQIQISPLPEISLEALDCACFDEKTAHEFKR